MSETIEQPTPASEAPDALTESALRAEAWAGEPFLHEGEDPLVVLAPGTARRRALDDAIAEQAAGKPEPSSEWKVLYGLMLGLERVLSEKPPHLASGTELRRHQIDALAGMLTELIAAAQKQPEDLNGNGNGNSEELEDDEDDELDPSFEEATPDTPDAAPDEDESLEDESLEDDDLEPPSLEQDPGAARRYRFRHPTASGKTIAAAGFIEAARTLGVLILTHRRLLVSQFERELTEHGYGPRFTGAIGAGGDRTKKAPVTIQTYAWFARHVGDIDREAYQLVIADEAHTALGEKTSAAIRSYPEPVYIGMTATEQLIAKQVSDVFPASVDDLPLADAARRGLIAPLRSLRVPPVAAIHNVPIIGGDFDEGELAKALDHQALNLAAASLYKERFDSAPGVVYAAGVEHAYNLASEFRAVGIKAEAVSGRTPPVKLAEILAAYERNEIDVLINAMLLAEGWNSPRATVVMHLAPTASKRVYQQRIGRIMRTHPRKEAGIVVDFVPKAATHNERVVSLHSLLDADFYREGARVTPAPRRRQQRRARRKLTPAQWLVPVTPDVSRRIEVIRREWQRIDPKYLDEEEQEIWATVAARNMRFDERTEMVKKFTERGASKRALAQFLKICAGENPNRRLRLIALADRVSMPIDSADFDDLVTLVSQAPPWEKDRAAGARLLLKAIAERKPVAPDQTLARWTWRLARAVRKVLDRKASQEFPDAKRLLGALANSRGHRHEENAIKLIAAAKGVPPHVAAGLLASAEAYTPRATRMIEDAREELGSIEEVAEALAENLPQPNTGPTRKRRRRRNKRKPGERPETAAGATQGGEAKNGAVPGEGAPADGTEQPAAPKKRRRRRRKPGAGAAPRDGTGNGAQPTAPQPSEPTQPSQPATPEPATAPARGEGEAA